MYLKYESNANWQRIMTIYDDRLFVIWVLAKFYAKFCNVAPLRGKQVSQGGFAVQLPTGVSYFNCQDLCSFTLIILFCAL